jgi:RNA polymerase sigma-70 factor, ECF subfamily
MGPTDRETLDELVSEHQASMLRLATRLTGRVESAEEVMQEALLRVTQNWNGFRGQAGFKTWATRILLNVFHDWLAKRRWSPRLQDVPDSRQPDPASCAMAEELGRHIAGRVSALPPRQREVLILLTYEGLSAEEAAQLLDIQVANVYSTLYEARQRLRAELAPFLANSDGHGAVTAPQKSARSEVVKKRGLAPS